jgi:hypothetical protein
MKWITAARGVRYYEHKTRKHGIRPDRYFTIYFRRGGKPVFEKLGWGSAWRLINNITTINKQGMSMPQTKVKLEPLPKSKMKTKKEKSTA